MDEPVTEAAAAPTPVPAPFLLRSGALFLDGMILAVVLMPVMLAFDWLGLPPFGLLDAVNILVCGGYFSWMIGRHGWTLGKRAAGLRVVRLDGAPLSYGRAAGRFAATLLSTLTLFLGYLAALFGSKRALHDYVAGTRVVVDKPVVGLRRAALLLLGVLLPVSLLLLLAVLAMIPAGGSPGASDDEPVAEQGASPDAD